VRADAEVRLGAPEGGGLEPALPARAAAAALELQADRLRPVAVEEDLEPVGGRAALRVAGPGPGMAARFDFVIDMR